LRLPKYEGNTTPRDLPGAPPRGTSASNRACRLSSIGIGTYLGEPDARTDQAYVDAIVAAVESGGNVIDSAINYRFQRSERSVRAALHELARRGFAREEMVICTKGGFLTPDGDMPSDASEYFNHEYVATADSPRR